MIYNLYEPSFLENDISLILNEIKNYYSFNESNGKITAYSLIKNENFWASEETHKMFNTLIPKIKSLHKDMYSMVESIHNIKEKTTFNRNLITKNYPIFNEFTEFNNIIKHYNKKSIEITFTILNYVETTHNLLDFSLNFKDIKSGRVIHYQYKEFIEFFIIFLINYKLIIPSVDIYSNYNKPHAHSITTQTLSC